MKGTALSAALDELGVDKDNFRVLGLLPLVYVAWADGKVQSSERALIHRLAKLNGWLGDEGDALLTEWLEEPPSEAYVASGLEVLRSLSGQQPPGEDSMGALIDYCRDVANAAGGLFGDVSVVTSAEEDALTQIAEALGVQDAERWQEIASGDESVDEEGAPGPRGHILVGNLLDFNESPLAFLLDAANNYGDVVHFTIASDEVYLLRKPEHVREVLVDRADDYRRGAEYRALQEVLGPSVLTTEGEPWKRLRSAARGAFDKKHIDAFSVNIVAATDRMLDRWLARERPELDVVPEMKRLVREIIGEHTFGGELGEHGPVLMGAVPAILDRASHVMANPFRVHEASLARRRAYREAKDTFDEAFIELVLRRRSAGQGGSALLDVLMAHEDELTHAELERAALAFMLAGHDTVFAALSWAFHTLSLHAVAARRVFREVHDKLRNRTPTHRDVKVCTYTNMFIDEVLRLYPPVWSIDREARVEAAFDGHTIPKGAIVMLSPWVTHRSPSLWDNPEGFDPDRFTEREVSKRAEGAYFPFGLGPHTCIGSELALMMLRLILVRVAQRFRLDLVPGFEHTKNAQLTLEPSPGLMLALRAV